MRDLTRLASRIVMFFMQFYYRLARHSRVSYKAYIDGRTRLAGYNTIQDNVLLAGARIGRGTYICRGSNFTDAEVGAFCSIGRNVRIVNGQHPDRKVVERCAMIRDFGDRTELVLEMWSRVKGDNLNTGIVLLIFAVFGILFVWIVWKRISIYKQKKRHHRRRRRIRR